MIVGKRLASGSRGQRRLARSGEVAELVTSLLGVVLNVLSNRSCGCVSSIVQSCASEMLNLPFVTELKAAVASADAG